MQRLALALLVLILAGSGLFLWLQGAQKPARGYAGNATPAPAAKAAPNAERMALDEASVAPTTVALEPSETAADRRTLSAAPVVQSAWIRGNVYSGNAGPLAQATVTAYLKLGSRYHELASGQSAADGIYELETSTLHGLDEVLPGPEVLVSFRAAGHQSASQRAVRDPRAKGSWQSSARLVPGANVCGRVVDAEGQGVPDAEVNYDLEVVIEGLGAPNVRRGPKPARTDAQGRFRLGVPPGKITRILARKIGSGAVERELSLVIESGDHEVGDLVLAGLQRLAGRVTYPDGQAASGLVLVAQQSLPISGQRPPDLGRQPERAPLQAWSSNTRTDAQGYFAFEDLQPGLYTIAEQDLDVLGLPQRGEGAGRQVWGRSGEGGPFQAGRSDLALTTQAARYAVEIRRADDNQPQGFAWVCLVPASQRDATLQRLPPSTGSVIELGQRFWLRCGSGSVVTLIAWECGKGAQLEHLLVRDLQRNVPGEELLLLELPNTE